MTDNSKQPASGSFAKLMSAPAAEQKALEESHQQKKPSLPEERTHVRTDSTPVRPYGLINQIPAIPEKRRPERYAFQFWTDQITRLKKLKQMLNLAKDPEDREETTLSDMVRQAMDEYLQRQTRKIEVSVRTEA